MGTRRTIGKEGGRVAGRLKLASAAIDARRESAIHRHVEHQALVAHPADNNSSQVLGRERRERVRLARVAGRD